MKLEQLVGLNDEDIISFSSEHAWSSAEFKIHKKLAKPLEELCFQANQQGHRLALLSGYRNYQRQCQIWQDKVLGEREILDNQGNPCNTFSSEEEKFEAIARWSAIPGTSRHHWGTDLDIFSAKAVENNYPVKLLVEEFSKQGPCFELEQWLATNLHKFQFFRPYQKDLGGIAPEPWHISYQPLASKFSAQLDADKLTSIWKQQPWNGSQWSIDNSVELFKRFVEIEC